MKNYRWVACVTFWTVNFVAYLDRVNLSVSATPIMSQFELTATQFGLILGAMVPGYLLFNFIGGLLVDRYSPIKVTSIAIIIWSLCTGWFAAITSFNWMYISRLIFGCAEGVFPSGITKLYANWMIPDERGRAQSGSVAFALVGMAVGAPLCAAIIAVYSWRALFVICCITGLLFTIIFNILGRSTPNEHPWMTSDEKKLIEKSLENEKNTRHTSMGNIATKREIQEHFKNPYIWLLGLCYFSVMCIFWANLTWLPSYFIKEKGFTVFKSGIMSAFPYLTGIVGLLCGGYITDKFMKTGRTVYGFVCLLIGPPVVFYALGATGDVRLILAFSISMFFIAGAMGQFWALTIDLFSVKLAGISSGIMSFIGYFGALVTPVLIGRIYDLTNSFYWGFGSATSVNFIGVIILIPLMRYEHRVHKAKVLIEGAVSNAEM